MSRGFLRRGYIASAAVAAMLVLLPIVVLSLQREATGHRNEIAEEISPVDLAASNLATALLRLSTTINLIEAEFPIEATEYQNRRAEAAQAAEALTSAARITPFQVQTEAVVQPARDLFDLLDAADRGERSRDEAFEVVSAGPLADYRAAYDALKSSIAERRATALGDAQRLEGYATAFLVAGSVAGALAVVILLRAITQRRRTEDQLRARERQQSALAEYGSNALATRPNLDALRSEAVRQLGSVLDVDVVAVMELLPDGDRLVLQDGIGWEPHQVGRVEVPANANSHAGYSLSVDGPVMFSDLETDHRFTSDVLRERGVRSGISAVVRLHDRAWGVLAAYSRQRREFTSDHGFFLRGIANMLASSILEREARARQQLLIETSSVLARSLNFEETLRQIGRIAVPEIADWCAVLLLNEQDQLHVVDMTSSTPSEAAAVLSRVGGGPLRDGGFAREAIRGRKPLVRQWTDAAHLFGAATEQGDGDGSTSVFFRSSLVIPLATRERTLGALALMMTDSGRYFREGDMSLGLEIGRRVAFAVDNASLFRHTAEIAEIREEFTSVVAHELRNPLTSVLGFARMLERKHAHDGPAHDADHDALLTMRRSAERMQSTLELFVALARVEGETLTVEHEPVRLQDVISREVVSAREGSDPPPRIVERFPPQSAIVDTDPELLHIVVQNLISNGLKYGGANPEVVVLIDVDDPSRTVRLTVEDNGAGISDDDIDRIFERGYRGANAVEKHGAGLGLYICAKLAAAIGASLRVERRDPTGSRFILEFVQAATGVDDLEDVSVEGG